MSIFNLHPMLDELSDISSTQWIVILALFVVVVFRS